MPDRANVEQALAALISTIVYPSGVDVAGLIETGCRIYRGWPVPRLLEEELAQGVVHVSVQPVGGTTRDRTRYGSDWQGFSPAATLSGVVNGDVVTFSGTGGPGHVAGVRVDGHAYSYRMRSGDSTALVAAALAEQVRADRPAVAVGSDLYVVAGLGLLVRVVTDGVGGRELRRQSAVFRITFWCPDPATRDLVVAAVDSSMAGALFIDVGGWACRLQLSGESSTDEGSAGGVWRRDLLYSVEYPTTASETLSAMLFGIADVNGVPFVG